MNGARIPIRQRRLMRGLVEEWLKSRGLWILGTSRKRQIDTVMQMIDAGCLKLEMREVAGGIRYSIALGEAPPDEADLHSVLMGTVKLPGDDGS